jgi:hypothetical protein
VRSAAGLKRRDQRVVYVERQLQRDVAQACLLPLSDRYPIRGLASLRVVNDDMEQWLKQNKYMNADGSPAIELIEALRRGRLAE